jgi:hypothetical protein
MEREALKVLRKNISQDFSTLYDLDSFDIDDRKEIEELLLKPDTISSKAKLDSLCGNIEGKVVEEKFETLLYLKGSRKASAALGVYKGDLKLEEDNATKAVDKAREERRLAKEQFEEFQKSVKELIHEKLNKDSIKEALSENYIQEVFMNKKQEIAEQLSSKIARLMNSSSKFTGILCDILLNKSKQLGTALTNIFREKKVEFTEGESSRLRVELKTLTKDLLTTVVLTGNSAWGNKIANAKNPIYNNSVIQALEIAQEKINSLWNKVLENNKDILFDGLELPDLKMADSGLINQDLEGVQLDSANSAVVSTMIKSVLSNTLGVLTSIITAIAVLSLLDVFVSGGITAFIALVTAIIASKKAGKSVREVINERFETRMYNKLKDELYKHLDKEFNKEVTKNSLSRLARANVELLINNNIQKCENALITQKSVFENRVDKAEAFFLQTEEKRKDTAKKAKKKRITQIEPALKLIEGFESGLQPYFNS